MFISFSRRQKCRLFSGFVYVKVCFVSKMVIGIEFSDFQSLTLFVNDQKNSEMILLYVFKLIFFRNKDTSSIDIVLEYARIKCTKKYFSILSAYIIIQFESNVCYRRIRIISKDKKRNRIPKLSMTKVES